MRRAVPLLFALSMISTPVLADPPDIHVDVPNGAKGMEVYVHERDIAPGEKVAWHLHHGTEIGYVLSGAFNLQIADGPIRHLAQGDSFEIDPDTAHRAYNDGTVTAALLLTYLRQKAGPLAIPASPAGAH
jgi:quercetin dioxygenase-like cupin family protein